MLNKGDFLDNRYEIEGRIGQGGMSVVYRAKDVKLEREVAIKVLKDEYSTDEEFIERFMNEARSAGRLLHPNIVTAYDIVDNDDIHYIVMELVEGVTLKEYIAKKKVLSNRETLGIALQAAEGMAEAHRHDVIHRDIKPQNIIISRDGKIKVADFGIARLARSERDGEQPVIGSAHYISPEQAANGAADARSDIYSLGITMYEMITGRLPFDGEDTESIIVSHMQNAIVPPKVYNGECYSALNDIIIKATRKAPEERYQSCEELISDLKQCAGNPDGHFVKIYDTVSSSEYIVANGSDVSGSEPAADKPTESAKAGAAAAGGLSAEGGNDGSSNDDNGGGLAGIGRLLGNSDSRTRVIILAATVAVLLVIIMIGTFIFRSHKSASDAMEGASAASAGTPEANESTGDEQISYTLSIKGEDIMPDLVGMTVDDARALLAGIQMSMDSSTTDFSDDYAAGLIMNQSPAKNEVLTSDSTVYVTVSLGNKVDYVLQNLNGMAEADARQALTDAGVAVDERHIDEFSDEIAEGMVTGYEELDASESVSAAAGGTDGETSAGGNLTGETGNAEGESPASGRRVALKVSLGRQEDYSQAPDLTGMTRSDAEKMLLGMQLTLGQATAINIDDIAENHIVSQSSAPGTYVKKGTAIDVQVSVGTTGEIPDGTVIDSDIEGDSSSDDDDGLDSDYYYGSIDTYCTIGETPSGPGSVSTVNVAFRLVQDVDGTTEYTVLGNQRPVEAGTSIPVTFRDIKGAYGVDKGTVEVYDVNSEEVYYSYVIPFEAVE